MASASVAISLDGFRFAEPEWLPALWILLLIPCLYWIRRRSVRVLVPHLELWERVLGRTKRRSTPWRTLVSILLQMLLVGGAIALLADPHRTFLEASRGHTVLLVDHRLGTLLALDDQGTSVRAALDERARMLVEEQSGRGSVAVAVGTDRWTAVASLHEGPLQIPVSSTSAWPESAGDGAVSEIEQLFDNAPKPTERRVLLTAFLPRPEEVPLLDRLGFTLTGLGSVPENGGIVAVEPSDDGRTLRVQVRGASGRRLRRTGLGPPMEVPIARDGELVLDTSEGIGAAELTLEPPDGFPLDDRVAIRGNEGTSISVLLVAEGPTPVVDAYLDATQLVDRARSGRVDPTRFRSEVSRYDVTVLVNVSLDRPLPPGRYLLLGGFAPGLGLMTGGADGPSEVVDVVSADPLLAGHGFEGFRAERLPRLRAAPEVQVVVNGSQGPLLSRCRGEGLRAVHLAPSPEGGLSTLPKMEAWPVFMEAALAELGQPPFARSPLAWRSGGILRWATAGDEVLIGEGDRRWPLRPSADGLGLRLPETIGHFVLEDRERRRPLALALLDHPGRPCAGVDARPIEPFPSVERSESWRPRLALLLLILLVFEGALHAWWITD